MVHAAANEHDRGMTENPLVSPPSGPRRLVRVQEGRVLAGVCAGVGRYLGVDPVAVRIAFVLLSLFGGSGVLAYIVAWLLMPEE